MSNTKERTALRRRHQHFQYTMLASGEGGLLSLDEELLRYRPGQCRIRSKLNRKVEETK